MRSSTLLRGRGRGPGPGPLCVLGTVAVAALLTQDLAASEPSRRERQRERPIPPRGRFFVPPALPNPIPNPIPLPNPVPLPLPPGLSELGATGPTDRCLVIVPPVDSRSLKTADVSIDPGIFARPRVQGLPIRGQTLGERLRR